MPEKPFSVRIAVRVYELDTQGHLNEAVYIQYAQHGRWHAFQAVGITMQSMRKAGVGPVALETTIRFKRELTAGDEVDLISSLEYEGGKTFRIVQRFLKADGTVAAESETTAGILDLIQRRLVSNPEDVLRSISTAPEVLDQWLVQPKKGRI